MRPLIILALIGVLVALIVKGVHSPSGKQWHGGGRFPIISISLIILILLPTAYFEFRWWYTERQASKIAEWVSGREDVKVHCERAGATFINSPTNNAGYVKFQEGDERGTGDTTDLKYETCRDLREWIFSDKNNPTDNQIAAVHVVVHESYHLAGERNELRTECSAMNTDQEAAEKLGASPEQAAALADYYKENIWNRLPDEYTGNCETEQNLLTPGGTG